MAAILARLRSALFAVVFLGGTLFYVLGCFAAMLGDDRHIIRVVTSWSRFHRFCSRWIVGQHVVVEGKLPEGPAFFVLKHEAMFETIDLPLLLDAPVIAAKKELLDLPLWGRAARAYGLIPVHREAGSRALRQLLARAQAAIAAERPVCLFAEGTRVPHGERPPVKSGFAALYALLRMPVVPVAIDSGLTNPGGGFLRLPGIVRYRVGEVIPAGLGREEAEARIHAAINALNR